MEMLYKNSSIVTFLLVLKKKLSQGVVIHTLFSRISAISLLLCLSTNFIHAQISFIGQVEDGQSGETLSGATLQIEGFNSAISTDEFGFYIYEVPNVEDSTIIRFKIQYLGHKPHYQSFVLTPTNNGGNVFHNFILQPHPYLLADVIISANRVEENLQDVAIAATAVSNKEISHRSAFTTREALEFIPNLITDAYLPNQATFSLRGLASNFDNSGIENSVALYIDGVYYSRSFNFNSTLLDVDRVEVLRGPQGTLFGKNTIGGVIHLITETPKMANSGGLKISMGSYNLQHYSAKANVQLIKDKLALRVTGGRKTTNGWMKELNPVLQDQNGMDFLTGRLSLLYKPNEKWEVLLRGNYSQDDKAEFTIDYQPSTFGHRLETTEDSPFDRISHQDEAGVFFERKIWETMGKATYKLDEVHTITSISSVHRSSSAYLKDFDATPIDASIFSKSADFSSVSQEFQIGTPRANRDLFYVGGLYFLEEHINTRDSIAMRSPFASVWQQQFGLPVTPIPDYFESVSPVSQIKSRSFAAFVSGSKKLTEQLRINTGLRWTHESKWLDFYQNIKADFGFLEKAVAQIGAADAVEKRKISNNALSFNIGLDVKTTEKVLLFANFSRGFKGAGFNTEFAPSLGSLDSTLIFKPEYINSYELGLKVKYSDRYQLNTSVFVTDYKNKQETAPGGSAYRVANADKTQGIGIESELVTILQKGLKVNASIGILRMRYLDFPFTDRNGKAINLSGNRLYKAPEFTLQLSPSYETTIGKQTKLHLQADYRYVAKTYNDIYNTESLARQSSGMLNARLAFSFLNERYRVAIWGKNLNNVTYFQHAWEFNFGSHVALNPPRTVGVEVAVNLF